MYIGTQNSPSAVVITDNLVTINKPIAGHNVGVGTSMTFGGGTQITTIPQPSTLTAGLYSVLLKATNSGGNYSSQLSLQTMAYWNGSTWAAGGASTLYSNVGDSLAQYSIQPSGNVSSNLLLIDNSTNTGMGLTIIPYFIQLTGALPSIV